MNITLKIKFILYFVHTKLLTVTCNQKLEEKKIKLPHILSGASSSNRIGCDKKISRDFKQSPFISPSVNCTFFPGLAPRTIKLKYNLHLNTIKQSESIRIKYLKSV